MKRTTALKQQKADMESARLNYGSMSEEELRKATHISYIFTKYFAFSKSYEWAAQCTCGWHTEEEHPITDEKEINLQTKKNLCDKFSNYLRGCPACGLNPSEQVFDDIVMDFGSRRNAEFNGSTEKCFVTAEKTNLPDDSILIRYFEWNVDADFYEHTVAETINEFGRVFVSENNIYCYVSDKYDPKKFTKASPGKLKERIYFDVCACLTPAKIKKLIRNLPKDSFRRKMLSLWSFGTDKSCGTIHIPGNLSVIESTQKYPQIFTLFESGYETLAGELCVSPIFANKAGNNASPAEILDIRPDILENILKYVPKEILTMQIISQWKTQINVIDEHPEWQDAIECCIENEVLDDCLKVSQKHGIPIPVLVKNIKEISRWHAVSVREASLQVEIYLLKCKQAGLPEIMPEAKNFVYANIVAHNREREAISGPAVVFEEHIPTGHKVIWFNGQEQIREAERLILSNIEKEWIRDALLFLDWSIDKENGIRKIHRIHMMQCTPEKRGKFIFSSCLVVKGNDIIAWYVYSGEKRIISFNK